MTDQMALPGLEPEWPELTSERVTPRYPVYVPSKGRPDTTRVTKLLSDEDIPFKIAVEPSEADAYSEQFESELMVLPEDNCGLWRSRNYCKGDAVLIGWDRHWQLDDNISKVVRNVNGKPEPIAIGNALAVIEDFVDLHSNIAVASMAYTTFGFLTKDKPYLLNKVNASAVLVASTEHRWRDSGLEDMDYSLQVLADGWCTVVFYELLIAKPAQESMKGGCTDTLYTSDDERLKGIRLLQGHWPEITTVVTRFGKPRPYTGHLWRRYKQQLQEVSDAA